MAPTKARKQGSKEARLKHFGYKDPLVKLMTAIAWAKREFAEGSLPCKKTLKRWVEQNVISGRIIDGDTYVFETEMVGVESTISKVVQELLRE
ncbi:MAG: hypothetical protein ACRCWB_08860 [Enterovibrio sp.]